MFSEDFFIYILLLLFCLFMTCPGSAEIALRLRESWVLSDAMRSVGSGGRSSHSVCLCLLG